MSLWATKSISVLRAQADAVGERSLRRHLGALNLITLGIGAIIGAGIFVLTGQAAALYAGPAVPLSFILTGIACAFAGLCYAEMASAVPVAGSAYTYSYATMGEFVAWIIGWDLVLEYAMGAATVGVGWSGHFLSLLDFLGIHVPAKLTQAPFDFCTQGEFAAKVAGCTQAGWFGTGAYVNLPAIFIVALMSYVLVVGIKQSATLTGLVSYKELNVSAPVALAVSRIPQLSWLRPFIDVGAVMGLASVILVMLLGQSRVFYSMSRDGLLGAWAGKVHPNFRTPYLSTIYTGFGVAFFTGLFPIRILGQLVNIGTLLAFVLVCGGVWILRHKRPDLDRPFRTPFVPVVPILGIATCLALMAFLPMDTWIRLFVWLVIGLALYFGSIRKHSVLHRELTGLGGTR